MIKEKPFEPAVFVGMTDQTPHPTPWAVIVETIRGRELKDVTERYRAVVAALADTTDEHLKLMLEAQKQEMKKSLPAFLPSAVVNGGRAMRHFVALSGFALVDFDGVDPAALPQLTAQIRADAHTVMEYVTVSGRGIRVIARFDMTGGNMSFPTAWNTVNAYYEQLTKLVSDRQCKNVTRISCMCHDADIYFNENAAPFTAGDVNKFNTAPKPRAKQAGGRHTTVKRAEPVVRRIVESRGLGYTDGHHNAYISHCLYLMNRFGVRENDALQWALTAFADYDAREHSVAATVKSCYQNTSEHNTMSIRRLSGYFHQQSDDDGQDGRDSQAPRRGRSSAIELQNWLEGRVESRYNVFTGIVEVKLTYKDEAQWQPESGRLDATIWKDMEKDGLKTEPKYISTLLQSDITPMFNPLEHYLQGLAPWDGATDHIQHMAAAVTVQGPQALWRMAFKKWLTGLVAGVLDPTVVNQLMICLIGPQGSYKTTFVNHILPPELRKYANVMNNLRNFSKDDALKLCESILLNCEEIDHLPAKDLNSFKALITQANVDERRAYARHKEHRPHIASFIATGNNELFLTDETGNRRFLPFIIEEIANPATAGFCYEGIYAQAWALWKSGFKYWLDAGDVFNLKNHVSNFEAPRPEYELILSRYRKPYENEVPKYMTSSEILYSFGRCGIPLSVIKISTAMKELTFDMVIIHKTRYWLVIELRPGENAADLPENTGSADPELPF